MIKISRKDIRQECSDSYFTRGRDYFDKGAVLSLEITEADDAHVAIVSTVAGRRKKPYEQKIIVTPEDYGFTTIEGDCTCPVGYNCKHVAAVCIAYQKSGESPIKADYSVDACLHWLDELNAEEADAAAVQSQQPFLAYVLNKSENIGELTVDLQVTYEKKRGGLAKAKPTNLSNILYQFNSSVYVQGIDKEIVKLLKVLSTNRYARDDIGITGTIGFFALEKILATGRCYWKSIENPPLHTGEERSVQLHWSEQDKETLFLEFVIEPGKADVLLTDPLLYLDAEKADIGRLTPLPYSFPQVKKLLTAPPLPKADADAFSKQLRVLYPYLELPSPSEIVIEDIFGVVPTPVLSLYGEQADEAYMHYMELEFDYAGFTLAAAPNEPRSIVDSLQGLKRIERDLKKQLDCIDFLQDLGFEVRNYPDGKLSLTSPGHLSVLDNATRWSDFIEHEIPALQQDGWDIKFKDSFQLEFHETDYWEAEILENQNDWFELKFDVEFNGKKYALLPLITQVLAHYDINELPDTLSLPISEHQFLNVPGERLKPFIETLYELFNSGAANESGSLTLSRYEAPQLAQLSEMENSGIQFTGGLKTLELGRKLKGFKGIKPVAPPAGFKAMLREYQREGLNWLQFLREYGLNGVLADDMGLGKTIQTLVHLLAEKQAGRLDKPCLIVAPTSLMSNWRREAEMFAPELSVLVLQGVDRRHSFAKIPDVDLVLTTYPLLPRDGEVLSKQTYHYLVLDEAQVIKNPRAQAAQIVRMLTTRHRLCLTGTPMENHLGELWALFDFLMPGFLGSSKEFTRLYRVPIEKEGKQDVAERLSQRVKPFLLRRKKTEVATELPRKTEIIRSVPLVGEQAALYESIRLSMEKKVRETISQKGLARSHITILDALLKLRQTCCDPRLLSLSRAQSIEQSAKLELLMDILPEQLEEGRRILLFSQFTSMLSLISKELEQRDIKYSLLTGQTRDRDQAIELFRGGSVDVFLISLKAGGIGLNLTEADTVILYDPWWNPAVEEQAMDRAHRIGQDKPVFVYKLLTENSVEEKILAMQHRKKTLADGVYGKGPQADSAVFDAEDLTALFAPIHEKAVN